MNLYGLLELKVVVGVSRDAKKMYISSCRSVFAGFIFVGEPVISCYWGSWSVYRSNVGTFTADMIPAAMCTHLVYGFAGLDEASFTIKSLDPWCDLPPSEGGGLST